MGAPLLFDNVNSCKRKMSTGNGNDNDNDNDNETTTFSAITHALLSSDRLCSSSNSIFLLKFFPFLYSEIGQELEDYCDDRRTSLNLVIFVPRVLSFHSMTHIKAGCKREDIHLKRSNAKFFTSKSSIVSLSSKLT